MQRAITKSVRKTRAMLMMSAATGAALAALTAATPLMAATVTWTGAVADPASGTYTATAQGQAAGFTTGQNLYLWNTSAANWSGAATYTAGDATIFTDNFAGGKDIRLTNGTLNPTSMTFKHITGTTAANYRFTNSGSPGDFTDSTAAIVSASSPFGSGSGTALTLDTGFLGTVTLRARSNSANTGGNTIVRSGILEISDGGALPHNGNQNQPPLTLDGGEFRVKVNTQGNTNPAAGQLGGTLTVLSDSTISNGETTRTPINQGASVWNGPVSLPAGVTLTLKSYTDVRLNLTNMNISGALGTIRLADDDGVSFGSDGVANTTVVGVSNGTNHDALGALIDLGTGSSEIISTANVQYDWGALTGGANTKLTGNFNGGGTSTFSIGARGDSTTFAGVFRDSQNSTTGLTALIKVGTGTLTLTGNS